MSSPLGNFFSTTSLMQSTAMQTCEEIRRTKLKMLADKHGGAANLCQLLGYARSETARLTRVLNANVRHDRGGKTYNMGDTMAREIEERLALPRGWMDNAPTYSEMQAKEDPRTRVMALMESLPEDQWSTVLRLVAALAQPAAEPARPEAEAPEGSAKPLRRGRPPHAPTQRAS